MDDKLELLIAEGVSQSEIEQHLKQKGWKTLADDGLQKVIAGITTFSELAHEVTL